MDEIPAGAIICGEALRDATKTAARETIDRYTRGVLLPEHAPGSFCTSQYTRGSVFKFAQFAPGACSQIFNRLNIVGWKFCYRG